MRNDLKEAKDYLKEYKRVIKVVTVLFVALAIMAYLQYLSSQEYGQLFDKLLENTTAIAAGKKGASLMVTIFLNNLKSSTMYVIMGIIPFIFIPGFDAASNGAILGAALAKTSSAVNMSPVKLFLLGVAPHGIFEIPALIVSATLGIIICREITRGLLRKPHKKLNDVLEETARCYVLIVLPLIAIASVIEAYITPMLL